MIEVAAAIILNNNKILITKRSESMKLSNLWEFPGGKIKENEDPENCVVREIYEELRLDIVVKEYFMTNIHRYDFGYVRLTAFISELKGGTLELIEHTDFAWTEIEKLKQYEFAPADIPIVEKLQEKQVR